MKKKLPENPSAVAYFSMEIGLDAAMATYSGGLGVLAGDTLRAAADIEVPMVAVTLLHRKGYFRQHLDQSGWQTESPVEWSPEEFLELQKPRATIEVQGRTVTLQAWKYLVRGLNGHEVPVYFLDSSLAENDEYAQTLTDYLYGGDLRYRLCQEILLGMGGIAMLENLGYDQISTFHMNEGHSALLSLRLLEELAKKDGSENIGVDQIEEIRERCVFTTHTPIPAGHDQFPRDLVGEVLGEERAARLDALGCILEGRLNMTYLGIYFSHYVNGVSMRHEQISQDMFPNYPFNSVTNGVHAVTWASESFASLYDRHIPEWREDTRYLRYAVSIPLDEIQQAHFQAKMNLLAKVKERCKVDLDPKILTLGFARRATQYKRADLLFTDLERLRRIVKDVGRLQIIYAGKAHPNDESGKHAIQRVFQAMSALADEVPIVYIEDYDMEVAKYCCSGVDVWLNTPQKPREASGTSGMKAAMNGVPSLSVLDGWWIEGCVDGITGWAIGSDYEEASDPERESVSLYDRLEHEILPMFYSRPLEFTRIRRWAIALNGSFFNAQRMVSQYMQNAYARLWSTG